MSVKKDQLTEAFEKTLETFSELVQTRIEIEKTKQTYGELEKWLKHLKTSDTRIA